MNMMMPISHRLYASAASEAGAPRRPAGHARPVTIEAEPVVRRVARPGAVSARAGEVELSSFWARARRFI